jgi:nitroreductase
MMRGSEQRHPDHPIDPLFVDRWSPRAMTGETIAEADLLVLFEAARWAPSSYNNQPWRILYARRDTPHWPTFFDLLVEGNRRWADKAAALLVFISKTTFDRNGQPSVTHSYDAGAAWENLALQGWLRGYVVHGMQGFDYERAREALRIPEDFRVEAMAAVGLPAPAVAGDTLTQRRPIEQTVCEGPFRF